MNVLEEELLTKISRAEVDLAKHLPSDPIVAYYVGRHHGASYERDTVVTAIYEKYGESYPEATSAIVGMILGAKHHE